MQATGAEAPPPNAQWERSGDLLQWGIPLVGLGLSYLFDGNAESSGDGFFLNAAVADLPSSPGLNWPGPRLGGSAQHDFLVSFARMELTVYGLKYAINEQRPNGGDQSFPSGHTAAAFMGAEYIRQQHGLWWGVPSYLAAGWVGFTRVNSKAHYWRDVVAGAAIGIAANYDFEAAETRAGTLSFGPTLLTPATAIWDEPDPLAARPWDSPVQFMMPGFRFEFRF